MNQEKGVVYKLEIPTDLLEAAKYILMMDGAPQSPEAGEYKIGYYDGIAKCCEILRPAIKRYNERNADPAPDASQNNKQV